MTAPEKPLDAQQADLLPCPFCGGAARERAADLANAIVCTRCSGEAWRSDWDRRAALAAQTEPEPVVDAANELESAVHHAERHNHSGIDLETAKNVLAMLRAGPVGEQPVEREPTDSQRALLAGRLYEAAERDNREWAEDYETIASALQRVSLEADEWRRAALQARADLNAAPADLGLPSDTQWVEWSSQANTVRWIDRLEAEHNASSDSSPVQGQPEAQPEPIARIEALRWLAKSWETRGAAVQDGPMRAAFEECAHELRHHLNADAQPLDVQPERERLAKWIEGVGRRNVGWRSNCDAIAAALRAPLGAKREPR